ncbi:TIR domain-containing protein [Citrus sinensis]|nr:TIR domain-containing protein [Citrus sinensis]
MTESNTIQLSNGVQNDDMDTQENHNDRKSLKSIPSKIRSAANPIVRSCTSPLQIQDSVTLSSSPLNSQLRDRSHRTHLLTTEAELGSTSPPRSPSHSTSPSRSPTHSSSPPRSPSYSSSPPRSPPWAQLRPLHRLQSTVACVYVSVCIHIYVCTYRDRSHQTHLLTTEADLGSTSPPPSHIYSPSRSPSWAQPCPPDSATSSTLTTLTTSSTSSPHPTLPIITTSSIHRLQDVDLEWIFVITNFVLEIPSALFDQLSSARKSQYVLLSMLLSFAALVVCIVELVYKCQKQKAVWRWKGILPWPWFYYRRRNRPFGNFKDIIGLVCALGQCIFAAIHYSFARRHADSPIKIYFWPLVFAFGLLCSKGLAK